MRLCNLALLFGIALTFTADWAQGQTPLCDALANKERALATKILAREHPYDCCDDTIAACLKKNRVCQLALRLTDNICRRIARGQNEAQITRALARRARSMLATGRSATLVLHGVPMAGAKEAPVSLVEYACGRCPYCAKLTPKIYDAVVTGSLKNRARFYFKVFPIRGHPLSKASGLGFMAAAYLGEFWPFALYAYDHFDLFCPLKQVEWAAKLGLNRERFEALLTDPFLESQLIASKKEGIVNEVDATPTFFINGRKYVGDMDIEELVDVVLEEYERLSGKLYRTP